MLRRLALVALLVASGQLALAQKTVHTETTVAYLRVKNNDGTYSYSSGTKIPVTITPISKSAHRPDSPAERFRATVKNGGGSLFNDQKAAANVTVFKNDVPPFIAGDTVVSALDDLNLAAGSENKAWKIVTFGIDFPFSGRTGLFLVRWIGFDTMTSGLGIGVSAFSGLLFDFGFYLDRAAFPPSPDRTFAVTVDLTLNPLAIVPENVCFFAQQFRVPQTPERGEGNFTSLNNVFGDSGGPTIGTSQDVFWFDSQPDGIYDETEPDNFGQDHFGAGTFMLNIQVGSGTTTIANPSSFSWIRGVFQSGSLGTLWFDDGLYNVAKAGPTLFAAEAPAQLVTETFVATAAITSLRVDVDAKVNTPGLAMKIDLFNFTTGSYVNVYTGAATTTDSTAIGFAATPTQFVDPATNTIRSKVSFAKTGPTLLWPWTASVDMVQYTVTNS